MDDDYEFHDKDSGFDRGIDYEKTKKLLIDKYNETDLNCQKNDITEKRRDIYARQLIYLLIAMIQLRNASRVSEAVRAFMKYKHDNQINNKVIVKISKSDAAKKNKDGNMVKPKPRYRNIVFPDWVVVDENEIMRTLAKIPIDRLKHRTLDYLLKLGFNTHSLRYSRINFLLNKKKEDIGTVAKYVGHKNLQTILNYVGKQNVDKMNDIDE